MSCAYPRDLETLGDHVRKCRLDLGLDQMTTGQRIGVHGDTVWNWESGQRKPEAKNLPAIIAFLGYDPRPEPSRLPERLVWYREGKGWSQERMAKFLGVDETSVSDWERGDHAPTKKSLEKIETALADVAQTHAGDHRLPRMQPDSSPGRIRGLSSVAANGQGLEP